MSEIDFGDFIDFVRANLLVFVIFLSIGILGSIAVFIYLPYKWSATVTVQIGKIPVLGSLDYIATPSEVVEKVKSPLFLSEIISTIYGKGIASDSPTAALFYNDLEATWVKGSSLVKIQVFGWTPEEAYRGAGVVAARLIGEHHETSKPYIAGIKKRLGEVEANIARNREVLTKIEGMEQITPSRNESNALLRLTVQDAKASELQKLQTEETRVKSLLLVAQQQPTKIIGRGLVPRKPTSPRLILLLVGGVFLGLMLGLVAAVSISAFKQKADELV